MSNQIPSPDVALVVTFNTNENGVPVYSIRRNGM
jgi:hypothetical protein